MKRIPGCLMAVLLAFFITQALSAIPSHAGGNSVSSQKYRLKVIHFAPVKVCVEINGRAAGEFEGNCERDVSDLLSPGVNRVKLTIEKNGECRIGSCDSLEVTLSRKDGTQYTHMVKARFLGDALRQFPDSRMLRYSFSI